MKRTQDLMELVHDGAAGSADIPRIVLIVDDHHDTLELYDAVLSDRGYWVARATNGLEALECAQDLRPDAIVTDVGLSGDMDGTDLIRELCADEKLCNVPVLVVTGRNPRDLPSFAGLPISGLLLKPVAAETLVTRVEHILQPPAPPPSSAHTGAPAHAEGISSTVPVAARATKTRKIDKRQRVCPGCREKLTWTETRQWRGGDYDYYRSCMNGCGMWCFNRDTQEFELLIES
jgi:CheY-like chemotaxis protein